MLSLLSAAGLLLDCRRIRSSCLLLIFRTDVGLLWWVLLLLVVVVVVGRLVFVGDAIATTAIICGGGLFGAEIWLMVLMVVA